jgi:hypothetical protein
MGRGRLPGAIGLGRPYQASVTSEASSDGRYDGEAVSASWLHEGRPSGQEWADLALSMLGAMSGRVVKAAT